MVLYDVGMTFIDGVTLREMRSVHTHTSLFCPQESLQDETRQKMTLATRVRALEEEKNGLMERLEEEEERSKELSRQIQTLSQQVI